MCNLNSNWTNINCKIMHKLQIPEEKSKIRDFGMHNE